MKQLVFCAALSLLAVACVKEPEPDLRDFQYRFTASGANKVVFSYSAEGNSLTLRDTLDLQEGTANHSITLRKSPGDFYYLRVSPIPQNSASFEANMSVEFDGSEVDAGQFETGKKGVTVYGNLPEE
jgi:hypothetical protein